MNKFLKTIRWFLLPFVVIIGTIWWYFIFWLIVNFVVHALRDWPSWFVDNFSAWVQSFILAYLAFFIAYKVAPNYKKKIWTTCLILFWLIVILIPIVILGTMTLNYFNDMTIITTFKTGNSWIDILATILDQFALIIGYLLWSVSIYEAYIKY